MTGIAYTDPSEGKHSEDMSEIVREAKEAIDAQAPSIRHQLDNQIGHVHDRNLPRGDSVELVLIPEANPELTNEELEQAFIKSGVLTSLNDLLEAKRNVHGGRPWSIEPLSTTRFFVENGKAKVKFIVMREKVARFD